MFSVSDKLAFVAAVKNGTKWLIIFMVWSVYFALFWILYEQYCDTKTGDVDRFQDLVKDHDINKAEGIHENAALHYVAEHGMF